MNTTPEQRSITADVAAIAGMLDDLASRTAGTPPEALQAIARALEAMVGIGAPLAAHGRYERLSADAGDVPPAVVGAAARQEAEDVSVAASTSPTCGCQWGDKPDDTDHDWLLGFEWRDLAGVVEVIEYFDQQRFREYDRRDPAVRAGRLRRRAQLAGPGGGPATGHPAA